MPNPAQDAADLTIRREREPDTRDTYTNLRVEADKLIITDQPTRTVRGLVLVKFRRSPIFAQDVYSILLRPRVTVLARDQGFAPLAWLFAFKARAKNVIAQILPEPQASLLTGILLGKAAHANGLKLGTWTVDATAAMKRLAGWGVNGISTSGIVYL